MNELDFLYKSEKRALEMMNAHKGFYEQRKARNRITRKILDWLIIYESEVILGEQMSAAEVLEKLCLRLEEQLCNRAPSLENIVSDEEVIDDDDTLVDNENAESNTTEPDEKFLSSISSINK